MSLTPIRIGAVSYLNARPLIYGLQQGLMSAPVELSFDYPSRVAQRLVDRDIDIGLVPVEVIPQLSSYSLVGRWGIGAVGEVASVCLFSEVPLESIQTLVLDYQSRTSVALLKLLLRHHWGIQPQLIPGEPGYEQTIRGARAGLVIGDRAFALKHQGLRAYDLSLAWQEWTGLPFVFAAWVSHTPMPEPFVADFEAANQAGLDDLESVIRQIPDPGFDLRRYYTQHISYHLDEAKLQGMRRFLSLLPGRD